MKHRRVGVVAVILLLAVASCSNSGGGTSTQAEGQGPASTASAADLQKNVPSNEPGVTDTEIRVESLGAYSNSFGLDVTQAPNGAQAYFDMVNAAGGIYGRRLVLAEKHDDQMLKNKETVEGIISQNTAFAVLPVGSPLFLGFQELADAGIPTFGWVNNEDWEGPPNFFGNTGMVTCNDCGRPQAPYAAREDGAQRVGVLALGIENSKVCADGIKNVFDTFPVAEVAYVDDTIPLGNTDFTVQVQKLKDEKIDMVVVCADTSFALNVSREMKKQQADTTLFLLNGYESALLRDFSDVLEGAYVFSSTMPLETEAPPPALADFTEWFGKIPGGEVGEQAMIGWVNAQLFHQGLIAAGPEFTQRKVIDAINQMTSWNAGGLVAPVDWTKAHTEAADPLCQALVRVQGGRFVPVFGDPGKPFICVPRSGQLPEKAPTV